MVRLTKDDAIKVEFQLRDFADDMARYFLWPVKTYEEDPKSVTGVLTAAADLLAEMVENWERLYK